MIYVNLDARDERPQLPPCVFALCVKGPNGLRCRIDAWRKVYSLHARIAKGRRIAATEFGVKVSIAIMLHRFEGRAIAHAKALTLMTATPWRPSSRRSRRSSART
jgi:hypothetical protein